MSENDVTQIMVSKFPSGIVGLKAVLEAVAKELKDRPDDELKEDLLNRLSKRNYISSNTREVYAQAFLREYKKFAGEPFEEPDEGGLNIKVLGPGCPKCHQVEKIVQEAIEEANVEANMEKITDVMEIAGYGVFGTPAVVVNGNVKSVGKIPGKEEVNTWLS